MQPYIVSSNWLSRLLLPRGIRLSRSTSWISIYDTNVSASRLFTTQRIAVSGVLLAAGLASCATVPAPPTPEMTRAEVAIDAAQKAGAGDLANDSLQAAQHKLDEAKVAAMKGEARRSQDLVEESMADAQLADLTAQRVKSDKTAAEVDKSINTLRTESDRRIAQ